MKKSIRSLKKAVKRFGDRFGGRRSLKLPKGRNPQLEKFEDRVLLSISPSVLGANEIDEGNVYEMQLSAGDDAVARWDIDWGDGTTTTGTSDGWGKDIRLNADGTWTATHVFADDMTASVSATAYDDIDAGTVVSNLSNVVSVADTAPVLKLKSSEPMKEGNTFAVILSSEDLGADTIDGWTINWGDGQVSTGSMPVLDSQASTAVLPDLDVSHMFDKWDPETWAYLDSVLKSSDPPESQHTNDWGDGILQITPNRWVAAHTYQSGRSYNVTASASDENGTYSAFDTAGGVDRKFGKRGFARAEFGDDLDAYCREMFVDEDGRIVMVGYVDDGSDRDYAIARFNADGTADTTFYGDGTVVIDSDSLIDSGSVNIAGLEIVAGGDGASTLSNTSLISSAMFDAMLQVDGVNIEADLLNASIAGVDTTATTLYGPLTPSDNLSVTNDDGVLRSHQSVAADQGFVLTRLCDEDGGLVIDIQSDSPQEPSLTTTTTEDGETLFSYRPPVMVAMVSTGTSAKMYLDSEDPNLIKEGDVYTLSIEVNNLAVDEEVSSLLIEWGDGTTSTGTPPQSGNDWGNGITQDPDGTWTAAHVYDDGNYAIEVTATTTLGTVWEYHPPIPGDCNMDGVVSDIDATILAVNWGRPSGATWASGDFDGDGDVDSDDMAILGSHWLDNINYGDGQLIVDNVEPLITLSGTGSADEGDLYTLNLESSDPGDDTITVWEMDWGDSSTETFTKQLDGTWLSDGSGSMTPVPGTDNQWTATHYYADNGEYTVNATATDEDGSWDAYGAYGTLDRHFGAEATGWVAEDFAAFSADDAGAFKAIVQPDGKILVAGYVNALPARDFAMARFDADGALDTNFGTGGLVVTDLGGDDLGYDVAIQPDPSNPNNFKIVVAGFSEISNYCNIAIARYTSDGVIDDGDPGVLNDGFGGNDTGYVLEDFGGGNNYSVYGLTILPGSGEIIVSGKEGSSPSDALFAKFSADGHLDVSFGSGGKLVFSDTGYYGMALNAEVLWDNVLVGTGRYSSTSTSDMNHGLFFFNTSGAPVSIGTSGVVEVGVGTGSDLAYGFTINRGTLDDESDDEIIIAGQVNSDFAVTRFQPANDPIDNFVLDTGFDLDGTSGSNDNWIDFDAGYDMGIDVVTLPSGRIVAAGYAIVDGKYDLAMLGLNGSDGSFDDDFDTDGKLNIDYEGTSTLGISIALDQEDNIITASWGYDDGTFLLSRLYGEDAGHKVEVENVEPELELTVEDMVDNQVTLKTFESVVINGTLTDPGFNNYPNGMWESFGYRINWGDGSSDTTGSLSSWSSDGGPGVDTVVTFEEHDHYYTETGTYTVTVKAWDDDMEYWDEDYVSTSFDVEVIVVPELVLSGDREINEGSQYTLGIELINPNIDPISELTIDWGDGTQTTGTSSTDWDEITLVQTNSWTATHTYTDDGNYAIQVWADKNTDNQIWSYHPPISGDANCDGIVGQTDFNIMKIAYGQTGDWGWRDGDFNGDGDVDFSDLGIIGGSWGNTFATADGQLIVNDVAPTMAAFPALATYSVTPPSTFNQFANNSSLYVQDGSNPYVAGYSEPNVGNDYVISGEVTYDAMTELGFLARADLNSQHGYVLSFDPTNRYFNLIKLTGGGLFENIVNHSLASKVPEINIGDTFRITFELDGSNITGLLYDSNGQLLDTISATDATYDDGVVGPWALNKGNGIEGTFSGMTITPTTVFPDLSASPQAPSTFTQSADNTNLYIHDDTGLFPYVASYSEPNVGNNYVISGEVTYDAMTALGFLARADVNTQCGYVLSFNPVNSHFKLIKQTGEWSYEMLADQEISGITVSPGDTFKFVFELDGSNITGLLYDSNGQLLDTINESDATYIDGTIGTWALNISNGIEGTFSGMALKPLAAIDGATSVDEGSLYTLTLGEVFDPGDDTTASYTVNWGDGQSDTYTPAELVSSDRQVTHTYADGPATRTISVDITNEEDTYVDVASRTITVNNVAPTLTVCEEVLTGDWRYGITVRASDPGDDTITSWEINWGDGTPNTTSTSEPGFNHDANAWTVFHDYAPDNTYNISIEATDGDCGVGESYELLSSVTVNAANVTPLESSIASDNGKTLSLAGDTSVYEGSEYSLGIQVSDQSTLSVETLAINWGDGTVTNWDSTYVSNNVVMDGSLANWTAAHTYADNGYYPIRVTATFNDGTTADLNAYHNPLLTGDANRDGIVDDADATILASNWQMATGAAWEHGDFDGDGDVDSTDTLEIENNWQQRSGVIVFNVMPTLTVCDDQIVNEGDSLSVTDMGVFVDPGFGASETFTCTIDWGDGTDLEYPTPTIIPGSAGVDTEGSFDGSHSYAEKGVYTVWVTVADDDNGVYTDSFVVYYGMPAAAAVTSATDVKNTQLNLGWSAGNVVNEIGFMIEKSTDGENFEFAGWAAADSTNSVVTGLDPGVHYWFRVNAYNEVGQTPSGTIQVNTTANLPLAPASLIVDMASYNQVDLSWTVDSASEQDGFIIEQSMDGESYVDIQTITDASCTTTTIDGLASSTTHYFRVKGYNEFGSSIYSNEVETKTTPKLTAIAESDSEIRLVWDAMPALVNFNEIHQTPIALPTLASEPSGNPDLTFNQTGGGTDLYVKDESATPLPQVIGYVSSGVGDDYLLSGEITFNNTDTELGLFARGDVSQDEGYVLSLDPTTSEFKLVKLTSTMPDNMVCHDLSENLTISADQTFKLSFEVNGSVLTGKLYDADDALLDTIEAVDTSYATGSIGTWALNISDAIEGTWSALNISEIFPGNSDLTFEQTEGGTSLHVEDESTTPLTQVIGYTDSNIGYDYLISSDITFDNTETELGLIARCNAAMEEGYVLSLDPNTSEFKLVKLTSATPESLVNHDLSADLTVSTDDIFKITLEVHGSVLTGKLYDSDGLLLDAIKYIDESYSTGEVGTWASKGDTAAIEGSWSHMHLSEICLASNGLPMLASETLLIPNDMPTLASEPSGNSDLRFEQTGGGTDLYVQDESATPLPQVIGHAASGVGDDYLLSGDITFNNTVTELGLFARGNATSGTGYVLSLDPDPTNPSGSDFKLVKLTSSTTSENLESHNLSDLSISTSQTFKITFEVNGSTLVGNLYSSSDGTLLDTIEVTDTSYATGSIGTWALRKSGSIEGTWSDLYLNEITPGNSDLTFTQSTGGTDLYVKDESTTPLPEVIGYAYSDIGDDYCLASNITFDNTVTELGVIARGNTYGEEGYVLSLDPTATTDQFKLVKLNSDTPETLDSDSITWPTFNEGDTFRMTLEVNGNALMGSLYSSDGTLLGTVEHVDDDDITYTTGSVGTWALRKSGSIEGTWSNMNLVTFENQIDGYKIEQSTDGGNSFVEVATAWEPDYTIDGLAPGTEYHFRTRAYNSGGDSEYSNMANDTTADALTVPDTPTLSDVNKVSYYDDENDVWVETTDIDLSWTETNNEAGFEIEQSTDGTNFTKIATTFPNCTSWTVTDLRPNTQYYFRVRAFNNYNEGSYSGYSNTDSDTTYDVDVAPWVSTAASASLTSPTVASLSVVGNDEEGASSVDYSWAATTLPLGVEDTDLQFSSSTSANTNVTLSAAGTYWFTVTLTDGDDPSLSTTSSVAITVDQIAQSIAIDPTSLDLDAGGTQQFTATGLDQFGNELTMPLFTWSISEEEGEEDDADGVIDENGLYTAPYSTASDKVKVEVGEFGQDGYKSAVCFITVNNHTPTVEVGAMAEQIPAGATAALSVLGADDAGESNLSYTWSWISKPVGADAPTISYADGVTEGTNAAKDAVATFTSLGDYEFTVTITDGGLRSVTDTVTISVVQTLTTITVDTDPSTVGTPTVDIGQTLQFAAEGLDQFGNTMATQPVFYWSATAGSIDYEGLYTPPQACMPATVTASSDGVTGETPLTINDPDPTTSARIGDSWLRSWWEESLGSPDTRGERIAQAAGATTLALSTVSSGAGFAIDPTSTFVIASPQNIAETTLVDDPAAATYTWDVNGTAFSSTEDTITTLVYEEMVDQYGAWTYSETLTYSYTITTAMDSDPFSSILGEYSYTFTASGDADGSTWTFEVNVDAPVLGPEVGGENEWSQTTSTTDTITNTTNITANTRSGERYGDGGSTWAYPGSEEGEEPENQTEYDYEIGYVWDPITEEWSTACTATKKVKDSDKYSDSNENDYIDYGVGWWCSGTVKDERSGSWSYSYTSEHTLLPTGWILTGGSGESQGKRTSKWSYDEAGVYWPSTTEEAIYGVFKDEGKENTTIEHHIYAHVHNGQWDVTQDASGENKSTGSIIIEGEGKTSYKGKGSYSSGICNGTQKEDGHDNYSSEYKVYFERGSSGWQIYRENGVEGDADDDRKNSVKSSRNWHDAWTYSAEGSYVNGTETGTISESGSQSESGDYDVYYTLDENNHWQIISDGENSTSESNGAGGFKEKWSLEATGPGAYRGTTGDYERQESTNSSGEYEASATFGSGSWDYDGSGSISDKSSSSYSYSGTGSYSGGSCQASRSNSAAAKSTTDYELNSEGVWQKSGASRESSGNGSTDWSYCVEGLYFESEDSRLIGTQSRSGGDDTAYDYLKTSDLVGSSWTYGGNSSQSYGNHSNWSYNASGSYTNGIIKGTENINGSTHYSQTHTSESTINTADGSWNVPTVTIDTSDSSTDNWSKSGSGSYYTSYADISEPTGFCKIFGSESGDYKEAVYSNSSSDYNATRTQGTNGKWTTSGSGRESISNGSSHSYNGIGTMSKIVAGVAPFERHEKTVLNQSDNSTSEYVEHWKPTGAGWEKTGVTESYSSGSHENSDRIYSGWTTNGTYYGTPQVSYTDRQAHDDITVNSSRHTYNGAGSQSQVETNHGSMVYSGHGIWENIPHHTNTVDAFNSLYSTTTTYHPDDTQPSSTSHCINVVCGNRDSNLTSDSYGPLTVSDPGYYSGHYHTPADFSWLTLTGYTGGASQSYSAAASSAAMMLSPQPESIAVESTDASPSVTTTSLRSLPALNIRNLSSSSSSLFSMTRSGGPSFGSYAETTGNRSYDSAGRLTSLTDANFAVTHFGYDAYGNLASLTDPVENTTQWTYDDQDRLTQETNELGDSRYYVYDAAGDLTRYIDRNGAVRQYTYDSEHRVVCEAWYASVADADALTAALNVIEYAYDMAGRLVYEADNYSSVAYVYNDAGQITSTTTASASTPTVTLDYQYDESGQRTQMAATIDGVSDFVEDYAYDASGRVISVSRYGIEGGNAVAEKSLVFAYNDDGQIESIQRLLDGQLAVQADYTYNDAGQLIGLVYHQGGTTLASYAWTYSDGGLSQFSETENGTVPFDYWTPNGGLPAEFVEQGMLPVHDTQGVVDALMEGGYSELSRLVSCTSLDGTATYSYDAVGQLTGADYDYQADESYSYDANGNRTDYIIGPDNRLLSDGTYRYAYDPEGNRIAKFIDVNTNAILDSGDTNITEYTWDARNRLTNVTDRAVYGGDPTQVVDYLYDLENRWIGKRVDLDGDGVFDSQEGYVYDGNQIVLQFEGDLSGATAGSSSSAFTSADLTHRYLWQPDAVDQLMADEQIETDDVVLALTDHLGTVRDLAVYDDVSDETAVVNHITYDSYGQKLSETSAVDCLLGFTGRAFDEVAEIQNNLNRWYDANTERWMSKDPIVFEGRDASTYRYVGNSPISFADATGLAKIAKFAKIAVKVCKETFEFTLENGKKIRIRNGKFCNMWVNLDDLARLTKVSPERIKRLRDKFPNLSIFYNWFGQPIFTSYSRAWVRLKNPGASNYAEQAWEYLKENHRQLYETLLPDKDSLVWHHAHDGTLQLIDKDLHMAYQHTGLQAILRHSAQGVIFALIPGLEEATKGEYEKAARTGFWNTAFAGSAFVSEIGCAFFDEAVRETYGGKNPYEDK